MAKPWYRRIYALYKGEVLLSTGTLQEISRNTGTSVEFLRYMTYPVYKKRVANRTSKNAMEIVVLED